MTKNDSFFFIVVLLQLPQSSPIVLPCPASLPQSTPTLLPSIYMWGGRAVMTERLTSLDRTRAVSSGFGFTLCSPQHDFPQCNNSNLLTQVWVKVKPNVRVQCSCDKQVMSQTFKQTSLWGAVSFLGKVSLHLAQDLGHLATDVLKGSGDWF